MSARPPFPEQLRPFVDTARERHRRRRPPIGLAVTGGERGQWSYGPLYDDWEAWEVQVCDALGTRSQRTLEAFLDAFCGLVDHRHNGEGWKPNERELNAVLNIVSAARPRDEMQACLAAQMAAVHLLTMRAASDTFNMGGTPSPEMATITARLARTFCDQTNTLRKLKSKGGRQHITVRYERHEHRHVHVHEAGEGVRKLEPKPKDAHAHTAAENPALKSSRLLALALANLSPRCLARTRRGTACQRPARKGRPRCALHGCGNGSGAPRGKANGSWKGGAWTNEAKALRRDVSRTLKAWREMRDG